MSIDRIEHLEALELLIDQYRNDPRLRAYIGAHLIESQAIEDAALQVLESRDLDLATGASLDALGAIVGQPRQGQDDDTYRIFIKGRVLINTGDSTPNDIILLLETTSINGTGYGYVELPPAGFGATVEGVPDNESQAIRTMVQDFKPAAVNANFTYSNVTSGEIFHYGDDSPGYTSTNDPVTSPGGEWARS